MSDIAKIEELMLSYIDELGSDISTLYKKIPAGKRLRAKLVLEIAGSSEKAMEFAAVIELIHAASLLHDDVIDDSLTRRGVDSINAIFGNKNAIMLGDILYSKAYEKLLLFDTKIAKYIAQAVSMLSIGELLDVELSKSLNLDRERYFDMIYKKTAILIEATARCSAILANKSESKYALYGKNLGLAFQIVDDILDVTQPSSTLGKPALNDYKDGKTTIVYMDLIDELSSEDRDEVIKLFSKELDQDRQGWLLDKFSNSLAVKKSITLAKKFALEAFKVIEGEVNASKLQKIITDMVEREF
jgi:octaprenyl-diphosphate synthase